MYTDSHCHLLNEYYDNIDKIIEEAIKNGVNRFITSGYDQISNQETVELIKKHVNVYGTIGVHPNNVSKATESWFEYIKSNIDNFKIIAVGEIGLDYHYGKDNKDLQLLWFNKQLEYAEKNNFPVIIHSRDATEDTIKCLKKYRLKGVIHSFGGSLETAKEYINMGFVLGINGTITFKNSKLNEIIKEIDNDYIIIETDSPYLTPEPNRGEINYPKYIINIAKYIAELKNISLVELEKITNSNIKRIFDI